jgi:Methyltransferase domain
VDIPAAPVLPNEFLKHAKILSSRHDILPFLPKGGVFCEVGVAYGDFSAAMLGACLPRKFIAIDHFELEKYPSMWGWERLAGQSHEAFYRDRFRDEIGLGQMELMRGYSHDSLPLLPDASVDVFYVDAWHSYEAVATELSIIKSKIAPDGWIVLNDYTLYDVVAGVEYGVIHAAHEFMIDQGWEMKFLALHPLMFCDIALQRM